MRKTLLAAISILFATGCASTQVAGSYVRNVWVDQEGRVTALERCDLVTRQTHRLQTRVVDLSTQGCEVMPPAYYQAPPPPPPPVPPAGKGA